MQVGRVAELWRYPVKSMMGERLEKVECGPRGFAGDRGWATRDEVRGAIQGAKKLGGLMTYRASYLSPPAADGAPPDVEIVDVAGEAMRTSDEGVDAWLSAGLDHPVTLWRQQPASDLDHYRRAPFESDDVEAELRAIFGRDPDEPLPDLSWLPPDLYVYESPLGTYFDAHSLLVVTTTSLATLQACAPGSRVDVRRFRPNIVVELDPALDGYPEQSWIGEKVRIGDVVVDVRAPCPRCVMITRAFADLPEDRSLMRSVVRQAEQVVGVYAEVLAPGGLDTGAAVEVL